MKKMSELSVKIDLSMGKQSGNSCKDKQRDKIIPRLAVSDKVGCMKVKNEKYLL